MREWWRKNKLKVMKYSLLIVIVLGLFLWIWLCTVLAYGQERPQTNITLSRQLNNEGITLLEKGDKIAAAEKFESAHAAYPNKQAAMNAAVTFEDLASAILDNPDLRLEHIQKAFTYYNFALVGEKSKKTREKISEKIGVLEKQCDDLKKQITERDKNTATIVDLPKDPIIPMIEPLPLVNPVIPVVRKFKTWKWVTFAGGVAFLGAGVGFNCWAIDKAGSAGSRGEYDNAKNLAYTSYVFYALGSVVLPVSGYFFHQDWRDSSTTTQPAPKTTFLPNFSPDFTGFVLSMTF